VICSTYNIGDQPTLIVTFRNELGVLEDPTTIQFDQRAPDGTVTTRTQDNAVNTDVGIWEWMIPEPFDAPGTWHFRAAGTSGIIAVEEVTVKVRKSAF
jgi:hypothetical protein